MSLKTALGFLSGGLITAQAQARAAVLFLFFRFRRLGKLSPNASLTSLDEVEALENTEDPFRKSTRTQEALLLLLLEASHGITSSLSERESLKMETGMHTIVVTGAASGIGRSIARCFASRSWAVILVDIDSERGRLEEQSLLEQGYSVLFVKADISDHNQVSSLLEKSLTRFGQVDALCNNAGIEIYRRADHYTLE